MWDWVFTIIMPLQCRAYLNFPPCCLYAATKNEAELFYISILVQFEKDYAKAIKLCAALKQRDRDNIFFQFVEFASRFNMNDWDATISQGTIFINRLPQLAGHPLSEQAALFYLAVGDGHIAKMQLGQALSMFNPHIKTKAG